MIQYLYCFIKFRCSQSFNTQIIKLPMKDFEENNKLSLWKFVRSQNNQPNPQHDFKKKMDDPLQLKQGKSNVPVKKYIHESIFRRQPEKQKRLRLLSQQNIKSSKLYKSLQEQMKQQIVRNQAELEQLVQVKISQKQKSYKQAINEEVQQLNKQIWEIKNKILEMSVAIQQQQEIRMRLLQQLQEGELQDFQNMEEEQSKSQEKQEQIQGNLERQSQNDKLQKSGNSHEQWEIMEKISEQEKK